PLAPENGPLLLLLFVGLTSPTFLRASRITPPSASRTTSLVSRAMVDFSLPRCFRPLPLRYPSPSPSNPRRTRSNRPETGPQRHAGAGGDDRWLPGFSQPLHSQVHAYPGTVDVHPSNVIQGAVTMSATLTPPPPVTGLGDGGPTGPDPHRRTEPRWPGRRGLVALVVAAALIGGSAGAG